MITAKVIKDGYILDGNHEYISEETYKLWMTRGFPQKGDILITTEAPLGEVALLRTSERVALAQRVVLLRGKPNLIDPTYYLYALKTPFVQRQLLTRAASTTVLGIKQSELLQVQIPYLPLVEQKRIAAIAQKADRLRRTRRYALQLSDTFLQSVFLEMFGDPGKNPKGWRIIAVDSLFPKERQGTQCGPFGSMLKKHEYVQAGIPVWGIDNVKANEFVEENFLFITKEKYQELKHYSVISGDILISRAGTTGRMCIARPKQSPSIIGTNLIRVSLDTTKIIPDYFVALFSYFQDHFAHLRASSDEGAYSFINTTVLKSLMIPLPPLPLQEKFAQIVQKFERLRTQQREAERQAEHLFQTILHRAFRGELTSEDINEEPASDILEPNPLEQTKPETTAKADDTSTPDTAKNPNTFAKQQYTEAIQLKLPGFE